MKTAPARWRPGPGTQPEALIREARRRQRRRYLAVGVAVIAVLGSAAGVAAGLHGSGSRPGLHSHARSPVAAGRYQGPGGKLWADQVTSGTVRASATSCCAYSVMVAAPSDPG
jgi:hypothetical protein